MCKPWVDSPCDYGVAEEIAFNLYAMDCEGMFNETINVNVNIDGDFTTEEIVENLVKELEKIYG